MQIFFEEWRALIGISLVVFFVFVMSASRKATQKRSSDRRSFFQLSGLVQNQSRTEEVKLRLSKLIPHWPALDALTRIKAQSIELHDCRFTMLNEKELCMVRFSDQFTRVSGTTTDIEMLRTVFIVGCDKNWPSFAIFFKIDLELPALLKKIGKIADSASSLITQSTLKLGITDPIDLQRLSSVEPSLAIRDIYTDNLESIQAALKFISLHQEALKSCGASAMYYRDGWLTIESIYATPSNEPGSKYIINAKQLWDNLKTILNS